MKKVVLIFLIFMLFSCKNDLNNKTNPNDRYQDMIELIKNYDSFSSYSGYFTLSGELAKIEDGYRYYVFIDKPRIAMYDLEVMIIEKNVDYNKKMAANLGILEEQEYILIPNQTNPDKGYYKGASISGTTDKNTTSLYILVQWRNSDLSKLYREFLTIDLTYNGA